MVLIDPAAIGREIAGSQKTALQHRLFDAPYHAVTADDLLDEIEHVIGKDLRRVIASQNLHGIHTYLSDASYRALHESHDTLVHIDGMPLVWAAKARGHEVNADHRTASIDWIYDLLRLASDRGWRVFHLGSPPEVSDIGLATLQDRFPNLNIGGRDGYFDMDPTGHENREVLQQIDTFAPDILLVGMGMGRQERWILQNLERLPANAIITTGAMMELISGQLSIPPRWIARMGFEWLYRLVSNTSAVAGRYLVEPFQIIGLARKRRRGLARQ